MQYNAYSSSLYWFLIYTITRNFIKLKLRDLTITYLSFNKAIININQFSSWKIPHTNMSVITNQYWSVRSLEVGHFYKGFSSLTKSNIIGKVLRALKRLAFWLGSKQNLIKLCIFRNQRNRCLNFIFKVTKTYYWYFYKSLIHFLMKLRLTFSLLIITNPERLISTSIFHNKWEFYFCLVIRKLALVLNLKWRRDRLLYFKCELDNG